MMLTFSYWHVCASVRPQIRCCSKVDDAKVCADTCKRGKVVSVAFSSCPIRDVNLACI